MSTVWDRGVAKSGKPALVGAFLATILLFLGAGPAVASWSSNRLDVIVRGQDGAVWHRWYAGSWSGWEALGGGTVSSPAAVSWGAGRLDVFLQGNDNGLWHMWYQGGWSRWESLGGVLSSGPAAASRASGQIDVIVRGGDGAFYQKSWTGSYWTGFAAVGGGTWPTGAAVTSQPTTSTLDLFTTGSDRALWHAGPS